MVEGPWLYFTVAWVALLIAFLLARGVPRLIGRSRTRAAMTANPGSVGWTILATRQLRMSAARLGRTPRGATVTLLATTAGISLLEGWTRSKSFLELDWQRLRAIRSNPGTGPLGPASVAFDVVGEAPFALVPLSGPLAWQSATDPETMAIAHSLEEYRRDPSALSVSR